MNNSESSPMQMSEISRHPEIPELEIQRAHLLSDPVLTDSAIFAGRFRDGVFNIIMKPDLTSEDRDARGLDILLFSSNLLYFGKFSDEKMDSLRLSASTHRTMSTWFTDIKVFQYGRNGKSVTILLMENQTIKFMVTLKRIDVPDCESEIPENSQKRRRVNQDVHISAWSDSDEFDELVTQSIVQNAIAATPEIAEFTTEFDKLKKQFPYINVELPAESPALLKLRECYEDADNADNDPVSGYDSY